MNFRQIIKNGIQKLTQEEQEAFLKEVIETWSPERQFAFFWGATEKLPTMPPTEVVEPIQPHLTIRKSILALLEGADEWLTVKQICERIAERSNYKYSAVARTLQKCFHVGQLRREQAEVGRFYLYARLVNPPARKVERSLKSGRESSIAASLLTYFSKKHQWVAMTDVRQELNLQRPLEALLRSARKLCKAGKLKRARFGAASCAGLLFAHIDCEVPLPSGFSLVR